MSAQRGFENYSSCFICPVFAYVDFHRCPSVVKWQPGLCDCGYWTGYWGGNCTSPLLLICAGLQWLNEAVLFLNISNLKVLHISVGGKECLNDFQQPRWRLFYTWKLPIFWWCCWSRCPIILLLLQDWSILNTYKEPLDKVYRITIQAKHHISYWSLF